MGDENVDLVRRAYRAFSERDLETLATLSHPQIEVYAVTAVVAGRDQPYVGEEGVKQYMEDVESVWDEIVLTPQEFTELSEERVLVSGRVRLRRDRTRVDAPNAWLWELEGRLVRRVRILSDPATIEELRAEG
jgi:ketosteroid isomerase-like protein